MSDVLDRLKTALADRYTIEREIGSGGMATVYLAEDLKHERKVAVKVLRPELAAALGPERFLQEIKIAANLHHPHILPLYDSGEADGFLYYVMPYVEGESLRDRLEREKQLAIEDALQVAREVADALSYAHAHGVIHRDIKPENILLESGHAVVADFGIARAVDAAGGERLTATGLAIGTPAYMSPEQAGGEQDLDGRSDLYSLGCVLHEMLAGQPPFTGPTVESLVHQHLSAEPPSVTAIRPSVPGWIAAALERSLAKTPADRFNPVAQFGEAISPRGGTTMTDARTPVALSKRRWLVPGVVAAAVLVVAAVVLSGTGLLSGGGDEIPRLVVLPFENLGATQDDYFADGITEEITSRIAEISGLFVISRTSAVDYANQGMTLPEIGAEANVDYVLEGTIRTDRVPDGSGQVRVTPQLIRVSDDAHLWTDRYTVELVSGEIFRIQAEIAEQVAQALDVTLLEPERQRLAARPTDNMEAYDFYTRGNNYYNRSDDEQYTRIAIQMYERATELDPDFAVAHARLSIAHAAMWWHFYDRTQERLAATKEAVDQALRLDPDLPEAHEALGWYHYWGHLEYESALAEFAIAQRSQPNSSKLFDGIGNVLRRQGEFEQALASFHKAVELDPRYARTTQNLATTYFLLRNPVEATRYIDRVTSLSPDWAVTYGIKARRIHLRLEGSAEKARAVLEEAGRVGGEADPWIVYAWVLLDMIEGNYQEVLERLGVVAGDVLFENQFQYVPRARLYAQIHDLMEHGERELAYYDSARIHMESVVQDRPDDPQFHSALGIAYAGLGRKEDAIREGELAVELLPMRSDAWRGAHRVEDLARIYMMVGEYDAAIDQLEILLAVPSPTSVPMLRIDPTWNPLRDLQRFRALLEEYGN